MFPHSKWVHVCVGSAAFTSLASLVSSIPFGSYNVSSSTRFSESRSVGFDGGIPEWIENFIVSLCLHIVHLCGSLHLFSSVSEERCFNNGLAKTDLCI